MFADKDNDIQTDIHNDIVEFLKTFYTYWRFAYHMNMYLDIHFDHISKNNNSNFLT